MGDHVCLCAQDFFFACVLIPLEWMTWLGIFPRFLHNLNCFLAKFLCSEQGWNTLLSYHTNTVNMLTYLWSLRLCITYRPSPRGRRSKWLPEMGGFENIMRVSFCEVISSKCHPTNMELIPLIMNYTWLIFLALRKINQSLHSSIYLAKLPLYARMTGTVMDF
jgi:hypothetical protein